MSDVKKKIAKFLNKTVSTERDEEGNTFLHYSVETDDAEWTEYLIASGYDVNAKNNIGDPPLIRAVRNNSVKATKLLLQAGATHVNTYFKDSRGPLHVAAANGFYEIVQILIAFGADVNGRGKDQYTPLHEVTNEFCAVGSSDYYNVLNVLIDNGANINFQCSNGCTALYFSVRSCFVKGSELLLSKGADVNAGNPRSKVLFLTVIKKQLHLMKRFLELGVDINVTNGIGNSLLHGAFMTGDSEFVEFLLDKGLALDQVNDKGIDPLAKGIQFFVDIHSSGYYEDDDHDDYLCDGSTLSRHISLIDLAIKRGFDINRVDNHGETILYTVLSNYRCHSDVLRAVLRNGATFDFEHPIVRQVMNDSNGSKFPLLLLRQAALFEAQNRTDGPANFSVQKLKKQSQKNYYANCQAELNLMKETKLKDSNVRFSDILFKKNISGYTRNKSIVSKFEKHDFANSFPIYKDLLIDRFSKELAYQKLVREAAKGLSHILQWDENAQSVLVDNIITYFDEKDLNTLADI